MNMTLENCSESSQELIFETPISVIHVRNSATLYLVWEDAYLVTLVRVFLFGIWFRAHLNCVILCNISVHS
jgi:hypothetical protein